MAQPPRNAPASRHPNAPGNDDVIEGEVVSSTERALVKSANPDLDASLAVALSEAEINQQIATAKRYPRSIQRSMDNIIQLATMDEDTAGECHYALPRGKDDDGKRKVIEGPSIRLAELIAQQWGNNRIAARPIAVDRKEKFVEAEGIYHDLETNSAVAARVRRRISGKSGALFSDDMILVTSNAAASIALRNAILRGVPKPVWLKAYRAVEAVIRGDLTTIAARRAKLITSFKDSLGVEPATLFAILQIKGEADMGLDEFVVARGFYSALRNNEVTVEDLLREVQPPQMKTLGAAFTSTPAAGQTAKPGPAETKPAESAPSSASASATPATGEPGAQDPAHTMTAASDVPTAASGKTESVDEDGVVHETTPAAGGDPTPEPQTAGAGGDDLFADVSVTSAETPAPAEEELTKAIAPEFVAYARTLGDCESWPDVRLALNTVRATDAYKAADEVTQRGLRASAAHRVEALVDQGKERVDYRIDPTLFLIWLDTGPTDDAIEDAWLEMCSSPGYAGFNEAQKNHLGGAVEQARERNKAAAQ